LRSGNHKSFFEEFSHYKDAGIIVDLDSIADLAKVVSPKDDLAIASAELYKVDPNKPSISYSLTRPLAFRQILERFASEPKDNRWIVAVSSHPQLTLHFKEKIKWAASSQQKLVEANVKKQTVEKRCYYCQKMYTELTNESNECRRHTKQFLFNQNICNEIKKTYEKLNLNEEPMKHPQVVNSKLTFNQIKFSQNDVILPHYKWECCERDVFAEGCGEYFKHSEFP